MLSPRSFRAMISTISEVGWRSKVFEQDFFQLSLVTVDEEHGYSKQCSAKKLQKAAQLMANSRLDAIKLSKRLIGGSVGIAP